jgi:hypothetical protein
MQGVQHGSQVSHGSPAMVHHAHLIDLKSINQFLTFGIKCHHRTPDLLHLTNRFPLRDISLLRLPFLACKPDVPKDLRITELELAGLVSSSSEPLQIPTPQSPHCSSTNCACHAISACRMNSSHSLVVFQHTSPVLVKSKRTSLVKRAASRNDVRKADG